MVAIAIVSLGVVAAIGLISKGLGETNDGRNQVVAALLAQEGVELVRNLRDSNWIGGTGGSFAGFPSDNAVGTNCAAYYSSNNIICPPVASANNYLKLNSASKFYDASDDLTGRYQRKIIVSYYDGAGNAIDNAGAETAEITSVVVWGATGFTGISTPIDATSCNSASKCSYAKTTLSKWRR